MGKNVHFIELFVYKQAQFTLVTPYFFIFSIFPYHAFTLTDFQYITVNPPSFSFHSPFILEIGHYPFTIPLHLPHLFPET